LLISMLRQNRHLFQSLTLLSHKLHSLRWLNAINTFYPIFPFISWLTSDEPFIIAKRVMKKSGSTAKHTEFRWNNYLRHTVIHKIAWITLANFFAFIRKYLRGGC
jgi:hypothetical protein